MIYDADAWLGHFPFQSLPESTASDAVRLMDRHQIDKALVANLNGLLYKDVHEANHELVREIAPHRDRLVPCALINPAYFGWQRDLRQCRDQFNMPVLRMLPDYHGYSLRDPCAFDIVHLATELDMAVALFWRIVDPRGRHAIDPGREAKPEDVAAFIRKFPNARFLLLNFRGVLPIPHGEPPARLYDIPLFVGDNGLRPTREFQKHPANTFTFGTTMPLRSPSAATLTLQKAQIEHPLRQAIQHKNLAKLIPQIKG